VLVECHKCVLAACSTYFEQLLSATDGQAVLNLDNMNVANADQLRAVVDFCYGLDVDVADAVTRRALLDTAEMFGVHALAKCCAVNGDGAHMTSVRAAGMQSLLLIGMQRFRRAGKFIDAHIGVAGGHAPYAPVHKLVLATFSDYFEQLLVKTDGAAMLSLEAVDTLYAAQIQPIFDYMYGVRMAVDERALTAMIDAARVFGIESLTELSRARHRLLTQRHRRLALEKGSV
jgi:hypothetical protein